MKLRNVVIESGLEVGHLFFCFKFNRERWDGGILLRLIHNFSDEVLGDRRHMGLLHYMWIDIGSISVPSLLAKSGVIPHSYSFCYDKSNTGRLYFGDQGPASQQSTSLLPSKQNPNIYVVEVDHCCVGSWYLKQSGFKAQVDTWSSFTYIPSDACHQVVSEFDKHANATRVSKHDFEHCYDDRSLSASNIARLKLVFPMHQSFLIENLTVDIIDNQGSFHCLGVLHTQGDVVIIGRHNVRANDDMSDAAPPYHYQ